MLNFTYFFFFWRSHHSGMFSRGPGSHLFEAHTSREIELLSPDSLGSIGAWPHGTWLRFAKLPPVLNIWGFCFSLEIKPMQVVPQLPWESEDGKDAVKLPHLRTSDCFSWEQVSHRLCLLGYLRGWNSFLSLQTLSGLTVTHITVWFNAPALTQ